MPDQFHFIHPLWLLGLLPLLLLARFACRPAGRGNPWRRVVDPALLPLMMASPGSRSGHGVRWLVSLGWLVAIAALADPTWQRKPQPVFQTGATRVVVLDLSDSMNDADLAPSRLARARYKVEDVLAQSAEGQTGLVVYAGDAFTVSPLTRDANTIRSLLKVLEPGLMPAQGSRADLGLRKAGELLRQAGVTSGQVLLIADRVDPAHAADTQRAAATLRGEGYRVSVLGVGTTSAVPLTDDAGRLARGADGAVERPALDASALRSLAQAGGGQYQSITDDGGALKTLLDAGNAAPVDSQQQAPSSATAWKELGPLIAVLLLPLGALAFRRNWLVSAALVGALAATSQGASAATWSDLWQRPDQQASRALAAGDYATAAKVAPDAGRQGSAQYKLGHYDVALQDFANAHGADADYDRGNALARLGRYPEAVAAYDKAISETSSNADAKANKAAVEALMKQQPPAAQKPQQDGKQQGQQGQQGKQGQPGQQQQAGQQGQSSQKQSGTQGGLKSGSQGQSGSATDSNPPGATQSSHGAAGKNGQAQGAKPSQTTSTMANSGDASQPSEGSQGRDGQSNQGVSKPAGNPPANAFSRALQKLEQWAGGKKDEAAAAPPPSTANAIAGQPAGTRAPTATSPQDASAQPLDNEEKLAARQWLNRIPDDPGGLLRRKFLYQYRHRAPQADDDDN